MTTSSIPPSTNIGKYVVIEDGAIIGENVSIGHHTIIMKHTRIGDNVIIGCGCILGIAPGGGDTIRKSELSGTELLIGNGVRIGNGVSLYIGTEIKEKAYIADHASIRERVSIGDGTVIGRGAMVELNSTIGDGCTIQTNVYVTGDTIIEDQVFVGPCVSMSNDKYMGASDYKLKGPHIKKGARIGNNASLLPGVTIGSQAIVGAGAVVTKDIPDHATYVGVPARKILYKLGGNP